MWFNLSFDLVVLIMWKVDSPSKWENDIATVMSLPSSWWRDQIICISFATFILQLIFNLMKIWMHLVLLSWFGINCWIATSSCCWFVLNWLIMEDPFANNKDMCWYCLIFRSIYSCETILNWWVYVLVYFCFSFPKLYDSRWLVIVH